MASVGPPCLCVGGPVSAAIGSDGVFCQGRSASYNSQHLTRPVPPPDGDREYVILTAMACSFGRAYGPGCFTICTEVLGPWIVGARRSRDRTGASNNWDKKLSENTEKSVRSLHCRLQVQHYLLCTYLYIYTTRFLSPGGQCQLL